MGTIALVAATSVGGAWWMVGPRQPHQGNTSANAATSTSSVTPTAAAPASVKPAAPRTPLAAIKGVDLLTVTTTWQSTYKVTMQRDPFGVYTAFAPVPAAGGSMEIDAVPAAGGTGLHALHCSSSRAERLTPAPAPALHEDLAA